MSETARRRPLLTVACVDCNDGYALLHPVREVTKLTFRCRRCKLVNFAEEVERLLNQPCGDLLTLDEYNSLIVSELRELHEHTVTR